MLIPVVFESTVTRIEARDGTFFWIKPLRKLRFSCRRASQNRLTVLSGGGTKMLTDAAIKSLKPKGKMYKVADRDGMYVRVMPTGAISFRLDYRLNGRRETVYLGKYGRDGISLLRARELCLDARRAIREGRSPAIEKQRQKRRLEEAKALVSSGRNGW
jgi:hypothetical protein